MGTLILLALSIVGCRRHADDVEVPGATMGCGIRGHMLNADGTPEVHARLVAVSLDRRSHVSSVTDEMGRFGLATDCQRLYTLAAQGPVDIASTWVWVADAPVDVAVSTPLQGVHLAVKVESPEDAIRMRIFALVPPTLANPPAPSPEQCDERARALQDIRSHDALTQQLALVAALEGFCGECPPALDASLLAGDLLAGRGIAEAWTNAYGRLFACSPGTHPSEAAFEEVIGELHPEVAAMVVFARIVEAEERLDADNVTRLWAKLRTGSLANTDVARNLQRSGEAGPAPR